MKNGKHMKNGKNGKHMKNGKNGKHSEMYDGEHIDRRKIQRERDSARRMKTERQDGLEVERFWGLLDKREESSHSSTIQDLIAKVSKSSSPIVYNNTTTYFIFDHFGIPLDTPIRDEGGHTVCVMYLMEFGYGLQIKKEWV